MHTIFRFEVQEVRSPTLQIVCKSKLKRRSYGCLKTTASSCAKISQPKAHFAVAKWATKWNPLAKFCKVFRSCETHLWHMSAISQPMPPSSQLRTTLWNHLQATNEVANHLQVAESPPSCEITNSNCKIKVQTWKMDNSMCEIHLCNIRYLLSTKLDFFSQDIFCKFLFSPCNQCGPAFFTCAPTWSARLAFLFVKN